MLTSPVVIQFNPMQILVFLLGCLGVVALCYVVLTLHEFYKTLRLLNEFCTENKSDLNVIVKNGSNITTKMNCLVDSVSDESISGESGIVSVVQTIVTFVLKYILKNKPN